jgi:A/G-specific adenine glycosylase
VHFWLTDDHGQVLLRTRPYKGLLGGMTELPGTEWRDTVWTVSEALPLAPMPALAWRGAGQVRHGFTHFELILDVFAAHVPVIEATGFAHRLDALDDAALPSVMRKCVRIAGGGVVG